MWLYYNNGLLNIFFLPSYIPTYCRSEGSLTHTIYNPGFAGYAALDRYLAVQLRDSGGDFAHLGSVRRLPQVKLAHHFSTSGSGNFRWLFGCRRYKGKQQAIRLWRDGDAIGIFTRYNKTCIKARYIDKNSSTSPFVPNWVILYCLHRMYFYAESWACAHCPI